MAAMPHRAKAGPHSEERAVGGRTQSGPRILHRHETAEAYLNSVITESPNAIFGRDINGRITFWSPAAEGMFGYTQEEMLGKTADVLIPPHLQQELNETIDRLHCGERVPTFETVRRRKDGSMADVSLAISPVEDVHRHIIGSLTILCDITEQKNAQRELARQHAEFESVLQAMADAVVIIDLRGEAVFMNEAHARLGGFSTIEEMKRGWAAQLFEVFDLNGRELPPDERPTARVLRGESLFSDKYWLRRRDTGRQWLAMITGAPVRDETGKQILGVLVGRDITEIWKAQQEALRRRAEFESVLHAITDPLLIMDMQGNLVLVNEPFARLHGFSSVEEVKGDYAAYTQRLEATDLKGRMIQREESPSYRALRGEYIVDERLWVSRRDTGQRWLFSITAAPVHDHNGKQIFAVLIARDITKSWETEQALALAHHELAQRAVDLEKAVDQRTQQLQSTIAELEAVSYSLSHDLRAPLRSIHSFAELVMEHAGDRLDETDRDLLRRMTNASGRMDMLIKDVLIYTRVARSEITAHPIDVERLLHQSIQERPELQPPEVEIRIDGPLEPVIGHEASLTQSMTNLLDNAVKFIPPGTKPRIRVWNEVGRDTVRLWFEDNGIGIAPESHERIFGMFQRLHNEKSYPGTGIGLAIVRKAVERMGGKVGVESELGHGCRFWVELPRAM